jgi:hypothetical protein
MKVKLLLLVLAIITVSSIEWLFHRLSGLVVSKINDTEEA